MNYFEDLGFFREYYIGAKFIGCLKCEKDRTEIGYYGKKIETLSEDLLLDNNKKIKKGTKISTLLYPLCGKLIKK